MSRSENKMSLIECIPNFSEGRDAAVVERIRSAISSVPGVTLLDQASDPDHHRSVFTFVGEPDTVAEAVLRAAGVAVEQIDLRKHTGVHPRIGALDVVPLVPLEGAPREICIALAHRLGQDLWDRLRLPVYFYGDAALEERRSRLEQIRRGGFEELAACLPEDTDCRPDVGGPNPHPSAGAAAVGVRKLLIAYNIHLASPDVSIAKRIATKIRESSGGLPAVKALGLELRSRNLTQVSMNLTDFEQTPPHVVFKLVKAEAERTGTQVVGGEVIGLIPRKAVEMAAAHAVELPGFQADIVLEDRLNSLPSPDPDATRSSGRRS